MDGREPPLEIKRIRYVLDGVEIAATELTGKGAEVLPQNEVLVDGRLYRTSNEVVRDEPGVLVVQCYPVRF
jgi:hypothetical protein